MKNIDPTQYNLSSRVDLRQDRSGGLLIIIDRKSRIIMKDGIRVLEMVKKINKIDNFRKVGEEIGQNLTDNENQDELYKTALELVKTEGKASTSFLQRKLQIGYNRAARIIDMMEDSGEVSKANHVGKREILK